LHDKHERRVNNRNNSNQNILYPSWVLTCYRKSGFHQGSLTQTLYYCMLNMREIWRANFELWCFPCAKKDDQDWSLAHNKQPFFFAVFLPNASNNCRRGEVGGLSCQSTANQTI
jgi:hypothetical protein